MITVSNVKRIDKIPFEDYLKMDYLSHSSLKQMKNGIQKEFIRTDKVRLGSIVDDIMTNKSESVDFLNPLYPEALEISQNITKDFGHIIKSYKSQVSYVGDFYLGDLILTLKGRVDWLLEKRAIIDLKVTEIAKTAEDCIKIIEYMGYDNQLFIYKSFEGISRTFIMMHSRKTKKTFLIERKPSKLSEEWLAEKIELFGEIIF